jgi:ATP-dependent exoDNAse (exonuclease V) alpha subunit
VERAIWAAVNSDPGIILVTGPAGTGKSHFLRLLASALPENPVILAPTGIAALRVAGQTLHSFFRLDKRVQTLSEDHVSRPRDLYRSVSTLIIDEISMVRADCLDKVDWILRTSRGSAAPFGGMRVIFFGDPYQLPPVAKKDERRVLKSLGYPGSFFFDSRVIREAPVESFSLDRVHRQRNRRFIEMLNAVRVGDVTSDLIRNINTRVFPDAVAQRVGSLVVTTRKWLAEVRNRQLLESLPTPEAVYRGRTEGSFPLGQLPVPKDLSLKPGARVLFIRNDPAFRWVNGTVGTILRCGSGHVVVDRDGGLGPCQVFPVEWKRYKHQIDQRSGIVCRRVIGRYFQLPLILGWAATIHRVQGLTVDRCHVDLRGGAFAPGQTYVALSRCRTLQGLTLEQAVRNRDIIINPRVVRFLAPFTGRTAA